MANTVCAWVCVALLVAAIAPPCRAVEELGAKRRSMKAEDINKGYSDSFTFGSKILKEEERKDLKGTVKQQRSRTVEDINKGTADKFKMDIRPRVETKEPQEISIDKEKSLGVKGNVKTSDKMSDLNKKK